ncbi:AbiJ-NTD4 domain-containing protein [Xanthomonas campestris]|uniref:AbiJ-NTD4 domain-containing protein n=1 Tax=Xanthomonas campestris TaxID=339 RepID=UPI003CF976EE
MSFSQRMGLKPIGELIQTDGIDTPLRNALWDALHLCIWSEAKNPVRYGQVTGSNVETLILQLWHRFFHLPLDRVPDYIGDAVEHVRKFHFGCDWNECYDLLEFCVTHAPDGLSASLTRFANRVLQEHLSGYRIVDGLVTPITSSEEIESIQQALSNPAINAGAAAHFKLALQMLSDRKAPDHRNSIKESISAVEAICKELTNYPSATLGQALKPLEDKGLIHPALKSALSKIYGYTSDSGGIRHAMLDESSLSFADSKFMLVACTAFANYLIDKSRSTAVS